LLKTRLVEQTVIARNHGVDLLQLVENLCLTPTGRARKFSTLVNKMLEGARREHLRKPQRKKSQGLHPDGVHG
jgi:hypothetical protein